jgi:hypothetical protein
MISLKYQYFSSQVLRTLMHLSKLDMGVKCGRYLNHAIALKNNQENPLPSHYYCKLSDLPNVSAAQKVEVYSVILPKIQYLTKGVRLHYHVKDHILGQINCLSR